MFGRTDFRAVPAFRTAARCRSLPILKYLLLAGGMASLAGACASQDVGGQASDVADRAAAPDADSLMPPLPGYATDDDAEPGELEASLDHGPVPYEEVRRRIVLDEQGFTSGAVSVVTFRPDPAVANQVLDHIYGDAPRSSVRVEGEEMIRIAASPFAVIAWVGPGFVVMFDRGQERSEAWLEGLVRATVRAVAAEGSR